MIYLSAIARMPRSKYSQTKDLLHTIGEYGNQVGMFYYPQGLALTSNQNLVTVSYNLNYGLQIFSSL